MVEMYNPFQNTYRFSQFGFIHMPLFALSEFFIFNLLCLQEMQNMSMLNAQKSGYEMGEEQKQCMFQWSSGKVNSALPQQTQAYESQQREIAVLNQYVRTEKTDSLSVEIQSMIDPSLQSPTSAFSVSLSLCLSLPSLWICCLAFCGWMAIDWFCVGDWRCEWMGIWQLWSTTTFLGR